MQRITFLLFISIPLALHAARPAYVFIPEELKIKKKDIKWISKDKSTNTDRAGGATSYEIKTKENELLFVTKLSVRGKTEFRTSKYIDGGLELKSKAAGVYNRCAALYSFIKKSRAFYQERDGSYRPRN